MSVSKASLLALLGVSSVSAYGMSHGVPGGVAPIAPPPPPPPPASSSPSSSQSPAPSSSATMGPALASCSGVSLGLPQGQANARANFTQPFYPSNGDCWEFRVPVTFTTQVNELSLPKWTDDFSLQNFLTAATTRASAKLPSPIKGKKNETSSHTIAASFCTPKNKGNRKKTIILATHGIGQARTHWNSAFVPNKFNFVQHALDEGYSVWFYDRLGQGESDKVSGFTNQLRNQKAILVELAKKVKNGEFTGDFGKPDKLAVMGFSFGSFITHFALAENPDMADAAILTGINYNTTGINANGLVRSFVPRVASLQNPRKFSTLDTGYLTWVDNIAQINTYFKFGAYDVATTQYCEEFKQAFAVSEFLTLTDGEFDASKFKGAALAITGKDDYIICDGRCDGIFDEPAKTLFKSAKFQGHLVPNAGHNINFHNNAKQSYKVMTDFLKSNNL